MTGDLYDSERKGDPSDLDILIMWIDPTRFPPWLSYVSSRDAQTENVFADLNIISYAM